MAQRMAWPSVVLLVGVALLAAVAWGAGRAAGAPVAALESSVALTGAPQWHARGYRGEGQLIAIYDVGFEGYQSRLGTTLPPADRVEVRSFRGQGQIDPPGETHGTAVAEVVHTMAPDARLLLVNYDPADPRSINDAYEYAVSRRPSVLQASVFFVSLYHGDGTGPENQNAADAEAAGILWVQSAGNFGQRHWSGTAGGAGTVDGHVVLAPGAGAAATSQTVRLTAGQPYRIVLKWYDWETRDQRYHLVVEQDGRVVAEATRQADARGAVPLEYLELRPATSGEYQVRIRALTATRPVRINLFSYDVELGTPEPASSLSNYADSPHVLTVGAVRWDTQQIEPYSGRGPTLDGRTKPDLVGPTCIPVSVQVTATTGTTFCGTSAAAPFVSGAAALVRQAQPELTPAQVRDLLRARARDAGAAGPDSTYGWGLLQLGAPPGGYRILLPAVMR